MSKPYLLIDFENVQPKTLDRLQPGEVRIKVFLGQHQTRLMLELVRALQPFGADAEYIAIQGSGPDAVDFHIAFYIGRLAAAEPGATFTIISRDRGFDPLVRHLLELGIQCQRIPDIEGTPAPARPAAKKAAKAVHKAVPKVAAKKAPAKQAPAKQAAAKQAPARQAVTKQAATAPAARAAAPSAAKGTPTRVAEVVARLKKSSKPAKMTTLRSSIKTWFKPPLDDKAVDAIVQSLQGTGKITVDGTKVAYAL
ncbi:MAG TPA: PIN domain-containing protein [Steroidobacteraceae bacterium]|nr:PIN domain-containing protein [Steroidobacteraceae bacterium]